MANRMQAVDPTPYPHAFRMRDLDVTRPLASGGNA